MNLQKSLVGILIYSLSAVSANVSADEYECYQCAVERSGYDPIEDYGTVSGKSDTDSGSDASESAGAGKAVLGGAARGAAIAEDRARAEAEAEARQKLVSDYERANAACLEGHGYVVK